MFIPVSHNDTVFSSAEFLADEAAFILVWLSLGFDKSELYSDGRAAIARSFPGAPIWAWSAADADLRALAREVWERFPDAKTVVAKPDAAREITASSGRAVGNLTRMTVYVCANPVKISADGAEGRPADADVPVLAELLAEDINATTRTNERVSADSQLELAKRLAANPDFRVWCAPNGEIASIALISQRTERFARINTVCTAPRHRGNGYAAALVSRLARTVLDEGLTPMLYADADYPSSNRAYIKAGFTAVSEVWENNYAEKIS